MVEGQLLTGDTDSLDVGIEDIVTNVEEVDDGPPAPASGSWSGRVLSSRCSALRKTWFLKETVMLLKLALPVVSTSQ